MPVVAEIKLVIDQFTQSVKRVMDYFAKMGEAAKKSASDIASSFAGTEIGNVLEKLFSSKQKGLKDLFSGVTTGGASATQMLFGLTKAFQAGAFAAQGMFATSLNMAARALMVLGPEFALVVAGLAGSAAGFVAVGAAIKMAASAVEQYTQLSAKAQSLGLKPETLRVLEIAFKRVGGDAYAATTALDKFYANLYQAKEGAGDAYQAFLVLSKASGNNLLPQQLMKMSNEQALFKTIAALKEIRNETQRLAIANKLFTGFTGTSGLYLKAIIDKGVIETTMSDLRLIFDMQNKMSASLLKVGEVGRQTFTIISEGVSLVSAAFAPLLEGMVQGMQDMRVNERIVTFFVVLADAINEFKVSLSGIGYLIAAFIGALASIGTGISGIMAYVGNFITQIITGIALMNLGFAKIFDIINAIFGIKSDFSSGAFAWVDSLINPQQSKTPKAAEAAPLIPAFQPVQAAIASSLTKVGGGGESFGAGGNDPLYDLGRQQLDVQKQIRDELKARPINASVEQSPLMAIWG